ncbi:MAG: tetratricopeptide repeat protein [Bacteroidales bacterium]|nr:tetratricopeptide repeat protein [Bacteroidales bacterium]
MIRNLIILTSVFMLLNGPLQAQLEVDSLVDLLPQKSGKQKAELYHEVAKAHKKNHNYEQALWYYSREKEAYRVMGDKEGLAETLNDIGIIYRKLENYEQALDYYNKSLYLKTKLNDRYGLAKTYNNMGVAYKYMEEYDKAIEYYLKALKIKEELGEKESVAKTLNNIGIILKSLQDFDKALAYYNRSLQIKQEMGDKKGVAITLNNIGIAYLHMEKYQKALDFCRRSLALKKEINYKAGIAYSLNNIAMIYSHLDSNKKALEYYSRSIKIKHEIGEKRGLAVAHNNLADIYIELNQYEKAHLHLDTALDIAREIDAKDKIKNNYLISSRLYALQNDYKNAYKYHTLYSELNDTILADQNKKKVAQLEARYNFEKREQELEFQRQKELDNMKIYAVSSVSLLFIFLSGVIYSRYRLKKRSTKALSTKTKQLEAQQQELAKSKARYSELVENAGEVILVVQGGVCKYINPRVVDLLNYRPEDIEGTYYLDYVNPGDKEYVREQHAKVSTGKDVQSVYHFRVIDIYNRPKWLEANTVGIEWDGYPASLNFLTDITERKKAELDLKRREAVLESIALSADEFLTARDIEQPINNMLQYLCEATNASRAHYFRIHQSSHGKLLASLVYEYTKQGVAPVKDDPDLQNLDFLKAAKKCNISLENRDSIVGLVKNFPQPERATFSKNDAQSFVVVPIYVFEELYGFIGFEECEYERAWSKPEVEALKSSSHLLAGAIMKNEVQEQLIKSKEKAEESDRLKSAFLANMSHEIRTPMNGILGFADLLKEPKLSGDEQQQFINMIESSGERMLSIINDLIDISKIESGQMEVMITTVNINEQIEEFYRFFEPEARPKGLKLYRNKALPDEKAVQKTDRPKLQAILTNLIKNAIKYTDEGHIEFGYQVKGDYLEFYVKDTGQGIRQNRLKAIFERFVQADLQFNNDKEGAGLGLAITQAYVNMLGGDISVESDYGKGTRFFFTIPYSPAEIAGKQNDVRNAETDNAGKLNGLTILIAEDEETSEAYLSKLLMKRCYEVIYAKDGKEAVDLLRKNPGINVVLMDIKMPVMDGYEATRKIREFNKEVKIIAQTAYALEGDRERALEAGCDEYISKPIKKEELLELLASVF